MTRVRHALLIAVAAGLWAAGPGAQEPQTPVFRSGVRTVPVYASVTDRRGGFVLDLAQSEFQLLDNGKPQVITQFTTDLQPLSMVILIDGSGSMMQVFNSVLDAVKSLILRMLPDDRTTIASFADIFQRRIGFTSSRDDLLAHLEDQFNIRVGNETRLWEALADSVEALSKETGRRAVVVLSDGKQWAQGQGPMGQPINGRPYLTQAPYSLVSLALDRDVMIYAVAVWTRDERIVEMPSKSIEWLAQETGGGYVEMRESDDNNVLATRISKELHQQYVLGFTPQVLDGKSHKLDLKVTRPGVTVRARRSYLAPSAGKEP